MDTAFQELPGEGQGGRHGITDSHKEAQKYKFIADCQLPIANSVTRSNRQSAILIDGYVWRGVGGPARCCPRCSARKRDLNRHVSGTRQGCRQGKVDDVKPRRFWIRLNQHDLIAGDAGTADGDSDFTLHGETYSRDAQLDNGPNDVATRVRRRDAKRFRHARVRVCNIERDRAPASVVAGGENVRLSRDDLHESTKESIGIGTGVQNVDCDCAESRSQTNRHNEIDLLVGIADKIESCGCAIDAQ